MKNAHSRPLPALSVCGVLVALATMLPAASVPAATIFESGTLGPTGVPLSDLGNTVPGTNIKDVVFTGVRFKLDQRVVTSQIGGHFVGEQGGTFFGAIVHLDDENDFPDSGDLSTPDVLGATLLTFPDPSEEVFGNLALPLDPGWYALVFGSGLFKASANGATVRNGMDIGSPAYIAFQPNSGVGWFDITSTGPNHRFVINGHVVPEPSTNALFILGVLFMLPRKDRHSLGDLQHFRV